MIGEGLDERDLLRAVKRENYGKVTRRHFENCRRVERENEKNKGYV